MSVSCVRPLRPEAEIDLDPKSEGTQRCAVVWGMREEIRKTKEYVKSKTYTHWICAIKKNNEQNFT